MLWQPWGTNTPHYEVDYFTDEEMGAQGGEATCARPPCTSVIINSYYQSERVQEPGRTQPVCFQSPCSSPMTFFHVPTCLPPRRGVSGGQRLGSLLLRVLLRAKCHLVNAVGIPQVFFDIGKLTLKHDHPQSLHLQKVKH